MPTFLRGRAECAALDHTRRRIAAGMARLAGARRQRWQPTGQAARAGTGDPASSDSRANRLHWPAVLTISTPMAGGSSFPRRANGTWIRPGSSVGPAGMDRPFRLRDRGICPGTPRDCSASMVCCRFFLAALGMARWIPVVRTCVRVCTVARRVTLLCFCSLGSRRRDPGVAFAPQFRHPQQQRAHSGNPAKPPHPPAVPGDFRGPRADSRARALCVWFAAASRLHRLTYASVASEQQRTKPARPPRSHTDPPPTFHPDLPPADELLYHLHPTKSTHTVQWYLEYFLSFPLSSLQRCQVPVPVHTEEVVPVGLAEPAPAFHPTTTTAIQRSAFAATTTQSIASAEASRTGIPQLHRKIACDGRPRRRAASCRALSNPPPPPSAGSFGCCSPRLRCSSARPPHSLSRSITYPSLQVPPSCHISPLCCSRSCCSCCCCCCCVCCVLLSTRACRPTTAQSRTVILNPQKGKQKKREEKKKKKEKQKGNPPPESPGR